MATVKVKPFPSPDAEQVECTLHNLRLSILAVHARRRARVIDDDAFHNADAYLEAENAGATLLDKSRNATTR